MLTGRRYKLVRDTLAVADVGGKRSTITIPVGEIIRVVADSEAGDSMVDVLWDGPHTRNVRD